MLREPSRKRPVFKWMLIGSILLLAIGAGVYWYVASEKFADTAGKKADFTVDAGTFLKEFETDNKTANQKYTEHIIAVNGIVAEKEAADTTINIKMSDSTTGSYIIFAFQDQHLNEARNVNVGERVTIKGSCSGGIYSEILGTNVISFKRSTLSK